MRRFLIGLTLALLLAVSIGIGILVADWPRWKRSFGLSCDCGAFPMQDGREREATRHAAADVVQPASFAAGHLLAVTSVQRARC